MNHRPRRRFGQHFLEAAWVRKVIDAAGPRSEDVFLEIGPGRGALTRALAPRVARLVAVEIDRDLARDLQDQGLGPAGKVTIITGDFLDLDLRSLVETEFGAVATVRVIGNLPYNASSPILARLIQSADLFADATLMLQREVADRLLAKPGTGEYGVLTVLTRVHAAATRLLDLPPGAFRPAPKVRSTVVRLEFHPPALDPELLSRFERLVRGLFQQRRKTVANALRGAFPEVDPARLASLLGAAGIDGTRRPGTLEMTDLSRLAQLIGT